MPRANRCFLPGYAWHVTHRCHDREFLLKGASDRDNWRRWLWEATSRYGLEVLNFAVTSNHIHLLVYDNLGDGTIARSMQLLQGQVGQSYNRRRGRRGSFWQDRYHAVAVDTGEYLWRCLAYVDLNMVRAGVVKHPREWRHGGYNEIQAPRSRYRVIALERVAALAECSTVGEFQAAHREQIEMTLASGDQSREPAWTGAIAVGSEAFAHTVRLRLGLSRLDRTTSRDGHLYSLRDDHGRYGSGIGRDSSV